MKRHKERLNFEFIGCIDLYGSNEGTYRDVHAAWEPNRGAGAVHVEGPGRGVASGVLMEDDDGVQNLGEGGRLRHRPAGGGVELGLVQAHPQVRVEPQHGAARRSWREEAEILADGDGGHPVEDYRCLLSPIFKYLILDR